MPYKNISSDLLRKYLENRCSREEVDGLLQYFQQIDIQQLHDIIEEELEKKLGQSYPVDGELHQRLENRLHNIFDVDATVKLRPVRTIFSYLLMAASVLLILGASITAYYLLNKPAAKLPVAKQSTQTDLTPPGETHAVITTADGHRIVLDSIRNGTLARQDNLKVEKLNDGRIVYKGSNKEVEYHTLNNPRGSKVVTLVLSDGTKVWLNAESSLTYPTAFTGRERKVNITGEAYFEVEHNDAQPFLVSKGDAIVRVLGTHFNINSYEDAGDIKVTLLQGSVKVFNKKAGNMLRPGQQARISKDIQVVDDVNISNVMAWKEGYFSFDHASLQQVMQEIGRWYGVNIVYEGKVKEMEFGGKIGRDSKASEVLKILQLSNVNFRIEGQKIIVTP